MEPLCSTNDEVELRIQTFATLLKELNKNNIKTVRYENSFSDIKLKQNLTLHDYCLSSYNYNRDIVNLLYSTMKRPYLSEEQDRDFYTYDDVKFVSAQNTEHNCIGLYIAKLKNTFAIGFNAGLFKDKLDVSYTLKLKKADKIKTDNVFCLTKISNLDNPDFINFIAKHPDLTVQKSDLPFHEKKRKKFPKHHGMKECSDFQEKILRCDYVIQVLNSIDFNSAEHECIHKVYEDKIEIRLVDTPKGYGVCIQTTAKTKLQNYWIANYIQKNYFDK